MCVSLRLVLAVAAIGALLAGCSNPRYQTFASYSPPQDDAGRQCVAQCSSSRQMCRQSGQPLIEQCRSQARMEAHLETVRRAAAYSLELERYGHAAPEVPGPASPDYGRCGAEAAGVEEQCKADYALCYQNCGGQISHTTRCVANCD